MKIELSREQILQLHKLICEYPSEETVELLIDRSSGIGVNITAVVRYASGTRADLRDITDYNKW